MYCLYGRDPKMVVKQCILLLTAPQFYRVLNIRVALVGLEVWSDSDKCPVTQDPFNTLHEFLDWRKVKLLPTKSHDNAQLIRWRFYSTQSHKQIPEAHTQNEVTQVQKLYSPYHF